MIICYNLFTVSVSVCGGDLWGRNMIVHLRQFEVSTSEHCVGKENTFAYALSGEKYAPS